jgi:hypothetical protein
VTQLDRERMRLKLPRQHVDLGELMALRSEGRREREKKSAKFFRLDQRLNGAEEFIHEVALGGRSRTFRENPVEFHIEKKTRRRLLDPAGNGGARWRRIVSRVDLHALEPSGVRAQALFRGQPFGIKQSDVIGISPTSTTDANSHARRLSQLKVSQVFSAGCATADREFTTRCPLGCALVAQRRTSIPPSSHLSYCGVKRLLHHAVT